MAYEFKIPDHVIIGDNALEQSEKLMKSLGRKAFIVTGKIVTKMGIVKILTDYLDKWGIESEVFNDITGEPTNVMIDNGVKAYTNAQCDFCIGIGGGSPLDSAKAIVAMSVLGGNIADYLGKDIEGDFPPLVLIPTTAGTGSEATRFTVITDIEKNIKMLLKGDALLPDIAVIDSELSITSPKSVTAATGMDALTHAVEAYTSKKAQPLTDMYALSAIKRIFKYLPIAYKQGDNKEAREQMALAAFEAGVCINNSSVTLVHGMSRPIGANFHVAHGISNAMLIKECLSYVLDGAYERFADIGRAIIEDTEGKDDKIMALEFIKELEKLCAICEIPTLEKYGIKKNEFDAVKDKMAQDAMDSGSPLNTIKDITKNDLLKIYDKLWK